MNTAYDHDVDLFEAAVAEGPTKTVTVSGTAIIIAPSNIVPSSITIVTPVGTITMSGSTMEIPLGSLQPFPIESFNVKVTDDSDNPIQVNYYTPTSPPLASPGVRIILTNVVIADDPQFTLNARVDWVDNLSGSKYFITNSISSIEIWPHSDPVSVPIIITAEIGAQMESSTTTSNIPVRLSMSTASIPTIKALPPILDTVQIILSDLDFTFQS